MRSGEERTFLFSARTFFFGEDIFLITYYNDISTLNGGYARAESEKILKEIFDSMSSYAMILRRENDKSILSSTSTSGLRTLSSSTARRCWARRSVRHRFARESAFLTLLENIESQKKSVQRFLSQPTERMRKDIISGCFSPQVTSLSHGRQASIRKRGRARY